MAGQPSAQGRERPTTTYDLRTLPALNRTATELRNRIAQYVDYMRKGGKVPTQVHVEPQQYETLRRAINSQISESAPLCGGLTFDGVPLVVLTKGGSHASA